MIDLPFDEAAEAADKIVQSGGTVYQKFTCSCCGTRQTIETPNKFYRTGQCEECNTVTDLTECGFMALLTSYGAV